MTGDGPLLHSTTQTSIILSTSHIPDAISQIEDMDLRRWLDNKRREYIIRLDGDGKPWKNLNCDKAYRRFPKYRRTRHKFELIRAVLELKEPYQFINLNLFRLHVIQNWDYSIFDATAFEQAKHTVLFYIGALNKAIALGEIKGKFSFPSDHPYSEEFRQNQKKKQKK